MCSIIKYRYSYRKYNAFKEAKIEFFYGEKAEKSENGFHVCEGVYIQ